MPTRTDLRNQMSVAQLVNSTRVADATPVASTAFDTSTLSPGARVLLILSAFETNTGNTGGTWSVTESATSGGEYTAASTGGSLASTPAEAGNAIRVIDATPNPAKPWLKVTFTGADANTEVDITAVRLVVPRAL